MKLGEIKDMVFREEWVLPPFQRGYVWDEEVKIREFLESVFFDWPTGSIILWTPSPEDEDVVKKRKLETKVGGTPLHLWEYIIDGQQRITTLLRALNNETFVFRGVEKKVCFDFASKRFTFVEEKSLQEKENTLVLQEIIDSGHSKIKQKLRTEKLDYDVDDLIDKIKQIEKYDIVIQKTPKGTSLKDAQELFIRLNTGGKQLPSVDLALAYISLLWDESRDEFKRFRESLIPTGFRFDFDFFVRCLSAISLKQSIRKKLVKNFSADTIKTDWERTKNGIEKTIDCLKTTLSLSSNIFLEAENALVPIVLVFAERENKAKEKLNRLAYWFITVYLNQRFSGQSTLVLNKDINTIMKSKDPIEGLLKNLSEERRMFKTTPQHMEGNQFKFILYCLYKDIRTKDFVSGFGIDNLAASASNKLDFHHIFADSILKETKFKGLKDDIANKTFLTNKTNKQLSNSDPTYLSDYTKKLLNAHLVPTDEDLWKLKNYERFLKARKKLISDQLNDFLDKLKGK
jgi:hypothetical protein